MKVRLVVVNPDHTGASYPMAVVEDSERLWLRGDDWMLPLPQQRLEDVLPEDARCALSLPDSIPVLLGDIRAFPDTYWLSAEMMAWVAAWKEELVSAWHSQHLPVASSS